MYQVSVSVLIHVAIPYVPSVLLALVLFAARYKVTPAALVTTTLPVPYDITLIVDPIGNATLELFAIVNVILVELAQ